MNKKNFIIDAHEDIALNAIYSTSKDINKKYSLYEGTNPFGLPVHNNVDIPRLREGNVKVVFTSIFSLDKESIKELMSLTNTGYNFKKLKYLKTGLEGAIEQLAFYYKTLEMNKKNLKIIKNKEDYVEVKNSKCKIGFILHSEGVDYFNNVDDLITFYNLGLRSLALTWRNKNKFASGNNAKGGLTKLGKELLELAQQIGVIVDLAHANEETFFDIINFVKKPVIVSHTNCYSVNPHNRNLKDDQIKMVAKNGGVIGMSVVNEHIGGNTIKHYVAHFVHIKKLVGSDFICFGTDFDGLIDPDIIFLKNFEDVSKFKNVIKELEKAGFKEKEIEKICYKNLERIILSYLK